MATMIYNNELSANPLPEVKMSDKSKENPFDEPTPSYHGYNLTDDEYELMRSYVYWEKVLVRDFFAEAYAAMVEERKAWTPKHKLDRFPWLGVPIAGKRRSISVFERHTAELEALAKEDGVASTDAFYTAVRRKVMEYSEVLIEKKLPPFDEEDD
jgi:hypothetical protein